MSFAHTFDLLFRFGVVTMSSRQKHMLLSAAAILLLAAALIYALTTSSLLLITAVTVLFHVAICVSLLYFLYFKPASKDVRREKKIMLISMFSGDRQRNRTSSAS